MNAGLFIINFLNSADKAIILIIFYLCNHIFKYSIFINENCN